jgi:hypothetical protein
LQQVCMKDVPKKQLFSKTSYRIYS